MNAKPFKVGDLAAQLGVVPNTVRNYCKRYAAYLSAGANPPAGRERLFTTRDLNVLTYINIAVNEGVQHDELAMQLAEKSFKEDGVDVVVGLAEVLPPESPPKPQEARSDTLLVHVALSTMQRQIDTMQRNQERLLNREMRYGLMMGSIWTLVAGGFLLWVLWLTGSG